ncbi:MAG TPA: serine hydrolase [Blastocatellia bacterium]|nr:serine hydrolase [Blastocatellia bacterium]
MISRTRCLLLVVPVLASAIGLGHGLLGQGPNPLSPAVRPASTQKQEGAVPVSGSGATPEMTPADLDAFLDGLVNLQLKQNDIAGATIAVVKDGRVLFKKGYGYADVAKKKPVSPDQTLFRCGSISKLFTWTAVMQQFEQGKLDLDRDINDYLDFKIPEAFGQPITLKNLMTHTPGFEEQIKDIFALDGASPELGKYLAGHMPARIFPPGTVPAYSNYGASLAGYIVQRVSGIPFDQYVQQAIFQPLGMEHSSFDQPLPPQLAPEMSSGYQLASDDAKPFETVGPFPAGSVSSAASDMARFMIAHLQDGRYADGQILKPDTAKLMHSRLFGLDPEANGMAYGFYEESRNGHRIIGHGGDTVYFHSDLHLIPDSNLGFFVSYNSAGKGGSPRTALWESFLDRYFPYTPLDQPAIASAKEDVKKTAGQYIFSRRSETSFFKLPFLLQQASVSARDDGTIEVDGLTGLNGKPKRWREVAPMVFDEVDGQDKLIFKPGSAGDLELLPPFPIFVGHRAGSWENQNLLLAALVFALLMMILTLLLWPVAALVRRHYGRRLELSKGERRLRLAVRLVCLVNVVFIIALIVLLVIGFEHIWLLNEHLDKWIHLVQILGLIGSAGALILVYNAIHAWLSWPKGLFRKLHATLLALGGLALLWIVIVGHLINFNVNY